MMQRSINVVIIGTEGVGKSVLGNILIGERIFRFGSSEKTTLEVSSHKFIDDDKTFNIIDTPALEVRYIGDMFKKLAGITIPTTIYDEIKRADVVLYVQRLVDRGSAKSDIDMMCIKTLYDYFGESIFKKMIYVFTLAKNYRPISMVDHFVKNYNLQDETEEIIHPLFLRNVEKILPSELRYAHQLSNDPSVVLIDNAIKESKENLLLAITSPIPEATPTYRRSLPGILYEKLGSYIY